MQPDTLAKPGEGLSLHTHSQDNMHSQRRFQLRHKVPYTSQYMNKSLIHDYTANVDANTNTSMCTNRQWPCLCKGRTRFIRDGCGSGFVRIKHGALWVFLWVVEKRNLGLTHIAKSWFDNLEVRIKIAFAGGEILAPVKIWLHDCVCRCLPPSSCLWLHDEHREWIKICAPGLSRRMASSFRRATACKPEQQSPGRRCYRWRRAVDYWSLHRCQVQQFPSHFPKNESQLKSPSQLHMIASSRWLNPTPELYPCPPYGSSSEVMVVPQRQILSFNVVCGSMTYKLPAIVAMVSHDGNCKIRIGIQISIFPIFFEVGHLRNPLSNWTKF